jgi:prefoldin subunit 5
MENLTTPLQKYINKLNRRIKTLNTEITRNETKINNIEVNKKKYQGPIPKKDKKTRK